MNGVNESYVLCRYNVLSCVRFLLNENWYRDDTEIEKEVERICTYNFSKNTNISYLIKKERADMERHDNMLWKKHWSAEKRVAVAKAVLSEAIKDRLEELKHKTEQESLRELLNIL